MTSNNLKMGWKIKKKQLELIMELKGKAKKYHNKTSLIKWNLLAGRSIFFVAGICVNWLFSLSSSFSGNFLSPLSTIGTGN
jgi:hypothetical protein